MAKQYNVLFVCTGNSARSIMAEALLNHEGNGRFTAHSAGSHPSGAVRPEAIAQLEAAGVPTSGLRSKSWDEFAGAGAPKMDFVFTVCDNAAKEACPLYAQPSKTTNDGTADPVVAHWGVPDPAAVKGSGEEIARAFRDAYTILRWRIRRFISLPLASLEKAALKKELDGIGEQQ